MKRLLKSILELTPYKITRRSRTYDNRFQAIEDSLKSLRARGYQPLHILDGGANTGDFSKFVLQLFPEAFVHAIEPQPGCLPALEALHKMHPKRLLYYNVAVGAPDDDGVNLSMSTDVSATSTGASISLAPLAKDTISVPCSTIDRLFKAKTIGSSGWLLKLDLQGYELKALQGANETLKSCDVILCEVSFYAQAYEPPIADLIVFLSERGFELYDIAAVYARPRDDRPRQGDFVFVRSDSSMAQDKAWS